MQEAVLQEAKGSLAKGCLAKGCLAKGCLAKGKRVIFFISPLSPLSPLSPCPPCPPCPPVPPVSPSPMSLTETILNQIPGTPWQNLQQADQLWQGIKTNSLPTATVIHTDPEPLPEVDWDVIICGGTLGIFIATTLAQRGWRVALLERGTLRGREQEWNISRSELQTLLNLELLSPSELETAIVTEYNPARLHFPGTPDIWVRDVLNIGVDPIYLLATLKTRFVGAGGYLLEHTPFQHATRHPNGIKIQAGTTPLTTRLLIDAMGHFSPIVRQARQGAKPDAICLVVGTCATGYPHNETGDLFASFTPLQNQCQYFWEAFPAKDGRTTYLFTYLDAHPERPSLTFLFEEYFRLLPQYQNIQLDQLQFKRALFGFFPCYRQSPLKMPWDRILAIGDSSASQSPLSFGGFGALIRHLPRLTQGIHDSLTLNLLHQQSLSQLQPYQPSLLVTWMFQRSMSVQINQTINPQQINQLLAQVFQIMDNLGEPTLKPFLQDIVQFNPLSQTLFYTGIKHPQLVLKIIPQVGILNLADWMIHYTNLGVYTLLDHLGKMIKPYLKHLPLIYQYHSHRWLDQWQYGSGGDYCDHTYQFQEKSSSSPKPQKH